MDDRTAARHLAGAELWVRAPADPAQPEPRGPVFVAGWEDGEPFCATVCSTDVGLAFCRRCPEEVVTASLGTGRPRHGTCPAGVRLLAFPAPRGSGTSAAVLRVGPPTPRRAASVAARTRVLPEALRRAARQAAPSDARAALAAARVLRTVDGLLSWEAQQRSRGSDRRRTATAALAQMIATSEEFHELYRASQRQRLELERNQRRLDRLARETLRASDQERARIAHQIHDTAAQSMVSAFRFLEAARAAGLTHGGVPEASDANGGKSTAGTSDVAKGRTAGYLEAASDRLVTAIREVRDVLAHLLPPGLEELGLAHAVGGRMHALAADTGLEVELTGNLPRLQPWVEQALYAMTAEAMTNAVRHANATRLHVTLGEVRDRAVVTVQDDGQGFDPKRTEQRPAGRGLGLLGIARQASWLGGRATVRTRPGGGTTVRISLPLARHLADGAKRTDTTPARDGSPVGPPASGRRRPGGERLTEAVR